MRRLQKAVFTVTFGIGCAVFLMGMKETKAAESEVYVETKESKVGNLYYEIIKGGKRVTEEILALLKDEHGNIVMKENIQKGVLWETGIPFGKYTIVICDKEEYYFPVSVDKEYIKTQHILKKLELERNFVRTGDHAEAEWFFLLCMAALIVASGVCALKRR